MEDYEASELEFMENWERKSLTWQEECQAIGRIHRERVRKGALVGEKWGQRETARLLGNSAGNVNYTLKVAALLDADDKEIAAAINMAEAFRIILRRKEAETGVSSAPKTETYFNPEDLKTVAQAPTPAPTQKEYKLHVWHRDFDLRNAGLVGSMFHCPVPKWALSQFLYNVNYEEHSETTLIFRNTSIKEGIPFIPLLEIFHFYWRRDATPAMKDVIPIFTDNPALERVLYGPGAMTDGWWDYIFEVVGRNDPVYFHWTQSYDGILYCLRKGIEVHTRLEPGELQDIQKKFQIYGTIEIITH